MSTCLFRAIANQYDVTKHEIVKYDKVRYVGLSMLLLVHMVASGDVPHACISLFSVGYWPAPSATLLIMHEFVSIPA